MPRNRSLPVASPRSSGSSTRRHMPGRTRCASFRHQRAHPEP
jgi:hypothetical protein